LELSWGIPPKVTGGMDARSHREGYEAMASPVGGGMIVSFASAGRWVATLQLYRRDPSNPFRAQDVAFARLVSPLIGDALAAALAKERAAREPAVETEPSGIIVVDHAARIAYATPAGERWTQRLRDSDPGGHAPLPTAAWTAIAALRSHGTVGAVTAQTPNGPVKIEASPAGTDGSVAIAILPVTPPPLPLPPVEWRLSPREQAICTLVLRGATNRKIAASLAFSEHTVETHLRHVFDKTGAESRVQLVARFFQATMLPGLAADS
jgi:DNA-binding CsgD family transcriptional regulator